MRGKPPRLPVVARRHFQRVQGGERAYALALNGLPGPFLGEIVHLGVGEYVEGVSLDRRRRNRKSSSHVNRQVAVHIQSADLDA